MDLKLLQELEIIVNELKTSKELRYLNEDSDRLTDLAVDAFAILLKLLKDGV